MKMKSSRNLSPAAIAFMAIALMLILVLSAGLIRAGGMEIFDNPGSAADWVAAVGTWAVGLAAAWVGWLSHRLQLADRIRRRMEDARIVILRQETMEISVNNARNKLEGVLRGIEREAPEQIPEAALKYAADCAATLSWSRDDLYLYSPTTRLLMARTESYAADVPRNDQQKNESPSPTSPQESRRIFINALARLESMLMKLEASMRDEREKAVDRYRELGKELSSHS